MKKTSWEIVFAGLLFIGLSFYFMQKNSVSEKQTHQSIAADSVDVHFRNDQAHIIELKNLERLKELENLGNLNNLKNLEKLKRLANFMPSEVKNEFIDEINAAIEEFDEENLNINIDIDKGLIAVDRKKDLEYGSWNSISAGVYAYVNEFDAETIEEISLSLPFGSITVVGTENKTGKLTVEASGQIKSKQDLESNVSIYSYISDSSVNFELSPKGSKTSDHNIHLHATLSVPSSNAVSISTNGGHIKSENISGSQTYDTKGGHINLTQLKGKVDAKTYGGHVSVTNSQGDLSLNSMGGHIQAEDIEGDIFMKTMGGNLQATNTKGKLEATTKGGNIDIRLNKISDTTLANTGAGTITLWVPKNGSADLDLNANSVEVDAALNYDGSKTSENAKGVLGNGGPLIKASTNYGKIILKLNSD